MSALIHSNSGFQEQKHVEINSIAYKPMVKESSLVLPFKVFAKNKESRSAMLHRTYTKKIR